MPDGEVRTGIREALNNKGEGTGRLTVGQRYDFHSGGSGTLVSIDNGGERYLKRLAQQFPDEFNRALRNIGWRIQKYIKDGVRFGKIGSESISKAEAGPRFNRMMKYKQGGERGKVPSRRMKGGRIIGGFRKGQSKGKRAYGKVANAVGYLHEPAKQQVQIGWMGLSSRSFGRMMAEGLRGGKYNWQTSRQFITPPMRRFFAATGRALPSSQLYLESPERPVIGPAFDACRPKINRWMEDRIAGYLRKQS